jgi:hypothetical protein
MSMVAGSLSVMETTESPAAEGNSSIVGASPPALDEVAARIASGAGRLAGRRARGCFW